MIPNLGTRPLKKRCPSTFYALENPKLAHILELRQSFWLPFSNLRDHAQALACAAARRAIGTRKGEHDT